MQISDHQYLEKVFQSLRKMLNLAEEAPVLELKTNDLGIMCVDNDESSFSSLTKLQ